MISGKPSMPLTKGYSMGVPKWRAKARKRAGARSWLRKKMTRWSSSAWRISAIVASDSSAPRSTPAISAPSAPAIGSTFSTVLRISLPPRRYAASLAEQSRPGNPAEHAESAGDGRDDDHHPKIIAAQAMSPRQRSDCECDQQAQHDRQH